MGVKLLGGLVEGSCVSGAEMRTLSANVSERLFAVVCEGPGEGVANGLLLLVLLLLLPVCDEEKGLAFVEIFPVRAPAPNRLAPKSCLGACSLFSVSGFTGFSSVCCCFCGVGSILIFLVARRALIQPGFRAHAFLEHAKMYNRRSSSGKSSGRSPCNSRRRVIGRLQTLQLANSPGGGVESSSHVW